MGSRVRRSGLVCNVNVVDISVVIVCVTESTVKHTPRSDPEKTNEVHRLVM